jgi:hypothetical protein
MARKPGEKRQTEPRIHEDVPTSYEHSESAGHQQQAEKAMAVVAELRGKVRTGGRKFTREEMNER